MCLFISFSLRTIYSSLFSFSLSFLYPLPSSPCTHPKFLPPLSLTIDHLNYSAPKTREVWINFDRQKLKRQPPTNPFSLQLLRLLQEMLKCRFIYYYKFHSKMVVARARVWPDFCALVRKNAEMFLFFLDNGCGSSGLRLDIKYCGPGL